MWCVRCMTKIGPNWVIFVTRWDYQHTGAIVWAHTEYIMRAIIFIAEAAWRMHRHTGQHHPTKAAQIQLTPLKCD